MRTMCHLGLFSTHKEQGVLSNKSGFSEPDHGWEMSKRLKRKSRTDPGREAQVEGVKVEPV